MYQGTASAVPLILHIFGGARSCQGTALAVPLNRPIYWRLQPLATGHTIASLFRKPVRNFRYYLRPDYP